MLGFFAFTEISTSVFVWFKSVQSATLNHTIHEYECSISIIYGTKVLSRNFKKVQHKMHLNFAGTMMTVLLSQVHSRNRFKPMKIIHKEFRRIRRESKFCMYETPARPLG